MKIKTKELNIKKFLIIFFIIISLSSCFKEKEISTKSLLSSYNKETYKIDLSNNSLKKIHALSKYLSWDILEETRVIDLSWNNIESIDTLAFKWFKKLEEINLSWNKIIWINLENVSAEDINLSNNNIEKVNILWNSITKINLSSNSLQYWSDIVLPASLIRLDISKNSLSNLDWFEKFKNIQNLNLMWNNLEDKHFVNLKDYKKLKNLNMSENNITKKALERINQFNIKNG